MLLSSRFCTGNQESTGSRLGLIAVDIQTMFFYLSVIDTQSYTRLGIQGCHLTSFSNGMFSTSVAPIICPRTWLFSGVRMTSVWPC